MNEEYQDPPKSIVRFANTVFLLGILFCIMITVYASYRIFNPMHSSNLGNKGIENFYKFIIIFGVVFSSLLGLGLKKLSNNLKVSLSVLFFTIGISIYGFETYLEFKHKDTTTRLDTIADLRDSGVNAFPNIFPSNFIGSDGLKSDEGRIYPLGTISNSTTILSNEGGFYPIVKTDEYGFNNSKGLYMKNKVDILLTGDSFTEGFSVNSDETISAVLRQLNYNAISVGKSGNGPLLELAALKEYGEPFKPKIVLWLYYINDLSGLEIEMKSSILNKYLNEDDYSQKLIYRQEEIDKVLKNYIKSEWSKKQKSEKIANHPIIKIAKLYNLRMRVRLKPTSEPTVLPTPVFKDVLSKSKKLVSNWNGKMYFVYLPDWNRYSSNIEHPNRDFVMKTAKELNIPIIDIHTEVFKPHPDPLSLFPFRKYNHYNADGYKLVAEAISKRLTIDGYIPIR
jgi:hypothetical protein